MLRFLKLLAVYVLPVFLFDGCFNRDPAFYLDDRTELIAPWQNAPLTLSYRSDAGPSGDSFQLRDVTEFLMVGSVFTGKTGEDYFMVRSSDGVKQIFSSIAKRDHVLKSQFALEVSELRPEPWYAGMRANHFYPYNLIYYVVATGLCLVCWITTRQGTGNRLPT